MKFTDAATVAGTRRTGDGYLVADARITRTGVPAYLGSEVGKPDIEHGRGLSTWCRSVRRLKSAAHRPVTNKHPPEMVTSDNWEKIAVGQTGDEIGESIYLRVPLMVSDEATIKDIETGKHELSAGYTCECTLVGERNLLVFEVQLLPADLSRRAASIRKSRVRDRRGRTSGRGMPSQKLFQYHVVLPAEQFAAVF
jgi:hypothetical protein